MNIIEEITDYIENNKIEEALELILKNEEALSDNYKFWNLKGILCIKIKEYKTAINCFDEALKINKNNIDLLYNLAYTYELKKDYCNSNRIYKDILLKVNDEELKNEINECLNRIKRNIELEECEIIIKNTDNKVASEFGDNVYNARSNTAESMLDDEKPLVSVMVQAYNNLEKYTKTCVECILKYTTDVNYELILVDNGSTDGTFEYFKTVNHPRKKIIRVTKNIGAGYGGYQGYLNYSSKYFVAIANDIYVTKNWLSNMVKCAMSSDKIGMINPCLDNVSNLQSVDLGYKDFDDMQQKAEEYNISDPKKWEERLRLITLGTLFKKECLDTVGFMDYGFFHDFGDDDITFRIRRAGYKTILCKDTFICHAGKITDKGAEISEQSLRKGKEIFRNKYYGIDAWNDVNYEPIMMQYIQETKRFNKESIIKVIGIDVACGAPILEVKNKLRNKGLFNTRLSAFSTEAKYWLDLKTICDDAVEVDRIDFLTEHFYGQKFDYIVMGKPINEYGNPYKLVTQVLNLLSDDGQLLVKLKNTYDIITLLKIMNITLNMNQQNLYNVLVDEFNEYLKTKGYFIKDAYIELHEVGESLKKDIKNLISFKTDNDYNKALVNNYVLNIVKNKK
ncbi:glycosyltransferase [Clostridium saccharobutylicum]|uniref:N-glycosyltransferase n=1 Tax=Clostridium saccharobutylicum TaxID=169679 RepID=A0A1S8NIE2_CLOSA|nr:glycosyltransferase [Clostridium saccharobutylicum]OOM16255.1 N-glycosyltransferase [Clostridium saccharobutylicum]